ncbi:cellulase family glycosylhydrolase [Candidatus Sumerlaeota bacterium]|nr:cellulase family glycosylhydrolase [Candidatus Sumerlaeota bacterium]
MRKVFVLLIFVLQVVNVCAGTSAELPTPYSIQMHTLGSPYERHKQAIDAVVKLGVKQVRDELFWHEVEQKKGVLSIPEHYMRNIEYSVNQGIDTLIILDYTNKFYDGGDAPYSDEARKAFARYAEFLARELKGKVRYFEVWNEPNVDAFWRPKKNPDNYVKLLKEVYPAVKRGNPDAVVIGVSLATLDMEFLNAVLEKGALEYMDVLSIHPYCHPRSPEEAQIFEKIKQIFNKTKKMGNPKPIWLTEIGFPTHKGGGITEIRQAEMIARTYLLSLSIPEIQTTFWYWLGPDGPKEWWSEDRFGILHQDGSPKPSYIALKSLINLLKDAKFVKAFSPAEKTHILQFKKGEEFIYSIWAEDVKTHLVIKNIAEPVNVAFLDGVNRKLKPKNKKIFLDATSMPIFIVSKQTLEFATSTAPITLTFPANNELPRGRKVKFSIRYADASFKETRLRLRPFPLYPKNALSQVSPSEVYINPTISKGKLAIISSVYDLTEKTPFALLVNECRVIEPVAIRLFPLPPDKNTRSVLVELRNTTAEPLSGRIFVKASRTASAVVVKPQTKDFSGLKPDDSLTMMVRILEPGEPDTLYNFTVNVELTDGIQIEYTPPPVSFYQCIYADKPIVIDGDLSDWSQSVQSIRINSKEQFVIGFRNWKGIKDCNARIYTSWDEKYFYVAAEIEDDALSVPYTGGKIYKNDGIEIYFDVDHNGDMDTIRYNGDDYQYGVSLSEGKELVWSWSQRRGQSAQSRAKITRNPTSAQTLSGKTFKGLLIEAAIPLNELKLRPHKGKLIGFNVALNDNDDPKSMNPFMQELQLSWTGIPNAYQNPTAFADLFFAKEDIKPH